MSDGAEFAAATPELRRLRDNAQYNADLADALHAQAAPLCIYLMDMREYFRWRHGLSLADSLPRAGLGAWIGEREHLWEQLRTSIEGDEDFSPFRPLLPEVCGDPFDTLALREHLHQRGLVYGAGVGRFGRPQFFLGRVLAREQREGNTVLICGEELARGAQASPAMSRGDEILIRQDALERWLWARYEEWRLHPHDGGLAAAVEHHTEAVGGDPVAAIHRMAEVEREALILHEVGERRIDGELGEAWHDMLEALPSRKAEMLVRSVRDLLADCEVTLPALLKRGADSSIHCWFGVIDGVRQKLSPGLIDAYRRWREGDRAALADRLPDACAHWRALAHRVYAAWREGDSAALESLRDDVSIPFR